MCGGTISARRAIRRTRGLSPRVRGNPKTGGLASTCSRSIPACAGEPRVPVGLGVVAWVYPRVCGGTTPGKRLSAVA